VRIDVDRLDALMNMVGELAIDRTRIAQISRALQSEYKEDEQVRALSETSTHIVKIVDELHESMMQVRMLPVGVLFSKFPRVVRDLARSLGKEINLVVEGEGTEIDRSVIDKIRDPLVHLLRNAVDHGVEPPEGRAAAGKPAQSTLKLTARHEQGQILIALADDGKGIDPAAIREAAVRKGEISQEAADRLSDREALELIFAPGLSTAQQTTEVSGRGVGGDVIRRDIESLNGRVEVESTMGVGTTFTLRLPLTLATFGGLLVVSGGRTYALPLSFVRETVRPEPEQLSSVLTRPMLNLRGEVMPLMPLWEATGEGAQRAANGRASNGSASNGSTSNGHAANGHAPLETGRYAVVVQAGNREEDRPVAIGVDDLIDQHEIVVKSLSSYLGRTRGIAGATILGDGQVVLIVDVPTLIKRSLSREADQPAATNQDGADAPLPVAALNGDAAAELSVAAIDSETRDPDVERNGA
jgi:two-component system chemotaxis sensor kinase CheA